jgi:hypothetical protein
MLHTCREFPCRSYLVFEFTLNKRRAGKAEMNLIQEDHRVTSKPWQ